MKSLNTIISILLVLTLSISLLVVVSAKQDPELKQCKDQCRVQQHFREDQREKCEEMCDDYYLGKQASQKTGQDPEQEQEQEEEELNPYVFEDRHFSSRFKTEHGRISVLQKFTEKSKLLKGIENYRLEILEANPSTFIFPAHFDAEALFLVLNGRGTIKSIRQHEKSESFNIKSGDLIRIGPGIQVYMINRDDNQKLYVAKLLQPVSTPGHYEAFLASGSGENPQSSFYGAFSTELLEAAFKVKRDQLEKVFGKQRQGVIVKASKEQIKALSQHDHEGGMWPFGEYKSGGPFNLFNKRPLRSNQFGRFHVVNDQDYKELHDLAVEVSFANITKGAMEGPFYLSKATKISFVLDGEGYFEMACPHVSSQSRSRGRQGGRGSSSEKQQQGTPTYHKITSRLKPGTVFVVPAGHPVAIVASTNKNLQVVCFEVNAKNNERFSLAGKKNLVSQFEKEAKELAFGVSSDEVDQVFGNNNEEFFFPGPRRQQREWELRSYA